MQDLPQEQEVSHLVGGVVEALGSAAGCSVLQLHARLGCGSGPRDPVQVSALGGPLWLGRGDRGQTPSAGAGSRALFRLGPPAVIL